MIKPSTPKNWLPGLKPYSAATRLLRRPRPQSQRISTATLWNTGSDRKPYQHSVIYNGHSIEMPPKELELLYFLASSPNQVFTREQLLDHIWGYEYIGDTRTVDVHIKRLREKIKDHDKWALTTVWGIGYKFEVKR